MKENSLMKAFVVFSIFALSQGQIAAANRFNPVLGNTLKDTLKNAKANGNGINSTYPTLEIKGTGKTATFKVNAKDLQKDQPISISVSPGFSVSPETLPANASNATITVKYNNTGVETTGKLILRSGDIRNYVKLKGFGTALPIKDISKSPVYQGGSDKSFVKTVKDGFKPTDKGYTVEFKVNTDNDAKKIFPFMLDEKGQGFKAYVASDKIGIYSGTWEKGFVNPITSVPGGAGNFYNNDKRPHVYRYAVTPDQHVFVYRDGIAIDTVKTTYYSGQPDFAVSNGDPKKNLIKNPEFDGEFQLMKGTEIVGKIEGWDVVVTDRYNSEQYIVKQQLDNNVDFNNSILQMKRYKWADGWGAAEIEQIIDVAPNETYTLSALARGGIKDKENKLLGRIEIQEVQDRTLKANTDVVSDSWETYSLDYTTSANCKQIRVVFLLERDKWGATISPLEIDRVQLTGVSRNYSPKIGFENKASNIDYFTYDLTGAYAPEVQPAIEVSLGK